MSATALEVLEDRLVGRISGSDLEDLTIAQVKTLLAIDQQIIVHSLFAPEAGLTFYDGWVAQDGVTIEKISLFAHTAPTGADLIVDLLRDGVAETKLATLTAGSTHEITDIADAAILLGERVGLKYTQIGSTNPGNGIITTIHYKIT